MSGDFDQADKHFAEASDIFEQMMAWRDITRVMSEWSVLAYRCGAYDVALRRCDKALDIAQRYHFPMITGYVQILRGHALLALGSAQAAVEAYQQGNQQMLAFNRRNRAIEALAGLARAEHVLGHHTAACAYGHEIIAHLDSGHSAVYGMFDPVEVCLTAYDMLCDTDAHSAARALAHGRTIYQRIIAQFSADRAELCTAKTPSLRRISVMISELSRTLK